MQKTPEKVETFSKYLSLAIPDEGEDFVLFRGQNSDWPLLPKIARHPFGGSTVALDENRIFNEFKRQVVGLIPSCEYPKDVWGELALAQHFGLATRLLDWTQNPLVAMWFAIRENEPFKDISNQKPAVIWKLNAKPIRSSDWPKSPFVVDQTDVFIPNHATSRIRVQASWFTVHGIQNGKGFFPLEEDEKHKADLTKFLIPAGKFHSFRKELNTFGVNDVTLFPDIDHLCRHINWQESLSKKTFEGIIGRTHPD